MKRLSHFIHDHLLGFLLVAYLLAVIGPGPGVHLRTLRLAGHAAPHLMLAWLLFNAGLGIRVADLARVHRRLTVLGAGLVANLAIPLAYVFALSLVGSLWPEAHETQIILVGLLISAAMPIAGSSTAWAQNVGGSALISLGLVLVSTALSPLTTPLTLRAARWITDPGILDAFTATGTADSSWFLIGTVVVPAGLGIALRARLGEARWATVAPGFKLSNLVNLLVLNYSNACLALPQAFATPDWDFLALIAVVCAVQCVASFAAGWSIARKMKLPASEGVALMYGLGMTNNGTGLVLASTHLAHVPLVTLPLIFANLEQQIIAGLVGRWLMNRARHSSAKSSSAGAPDL